MKEETTVTTSSLSKLGISLFDILILFNDLLIDRFYKDKRVGTGMCKINSC